MIDRTPSDSRHPARALGVNVAGSMILVIDVLALVPATRSLGTLFLLALALLLGLRYAMAPSSNAVPFLVGTAGLLSGASPPYVLGQISPERALVFGLAAGYSIGLLSGHGRLRLGWRHVVLWCLLAVAVATALWSPNQQASIGMLVSLSGSALLFAVGLTRSASESTLNSYVSGVVLAATISVAVGPLVQGTALADAARFSGVYGDPNFYATYLAVALPYALYWPRFRGTYRALAGGILVYGLFMTISRMGLVLVGASVLWGTSRLLSRKSWRTVRWILAALTIMLLVIFLFHQYLPNTLERVAGTWVQRLSDTDLGGLGGRLIQWRASLASTGTAFVHGTGLGSVYYETGEFAHSMWFETLFELGLVGVLCIATLLLEPLWRLARHGGIWHPAHMPVIASGCMVLIASTVLSLEYSELLWTTMLVTAWTADLSRGGNAS